MAGRTFNLDTPLGKMMRQRGISREQLAASSGVAMRSITYLARGEHVPSPETVARLCIALECDPQDIVPRSLFTD